MQVRGNQASVLGQVNRPGRYPLEVADMRLTDLLAMAGGTAPGGADVVVLSGTRNGQPFRLEVDLPAVFAAAGRDKDIVSSTATPSGSTASPWSTSTAKCNAPARCGWSAI
jgi:polysaccharide export outer membrane protein